MIKTILEDIEKKKLGFTLPHEHLFICSKKISEDYPALSNDDISKTLHSIYEFKKNGGMSIVDCQPAFCGRDTKKLVEISKKSSINIIASTGFHKFDFYERNIIDLFKIKKETEITEFFISEIMIGTLENEAIDFNDIKNPYKAGIIKTAFSNLENDLEKKMFIAAARTSKKTGVPLMIHTENKTTGRELLALFSFLTHMGVEPNKMIFAHLDRTMGDLAIHKSLVKEGCFLDYDTIVRYKYHDDEKEISIILKMLYSGFENNIMLSLDITRERLRSQGFSIMQKYFIPKLKKRGIKQNIIDRFFIDNPAAVLNKE